jgi:uroporphyrinogen-III decarboxylase
MDNRWKLYNRKRVPSRERYLRAVHHESGDVPFQENQIDIVHINSLLGRRYPLSLRSYEIDSADQVETALFLGNDMVYTASLWELGRNITIDKFGRKHYTDGWMKDRSSLAKIIEPDLGEYERRLDGVLSSAEGTGLGVIASVNHPPKIAAVAMGYQDYMLALYDDPQYINDLQNVCAEYTEKELAMVLSKPVDAVQTAVDICMHSGPMYSRDVLAAYEFPYLKRTIEAVKRTGKAALLHIDGHIGDLISDCIAMGADVLNPVEPSEHQDLQQYKLQYGDAVAFQGNFSVELLATMNPEEVFAAATSLVRAMASGGGFILASSHDIGPNIPWENVMALRDAAESFSPGN